MRLETVTTMALLIREPASTSMHLTSGREAPELQSAVHRGILNRSIMTSKGPSRTRQLDSAFDEMHEI